VPSWSWSRPAAASARRCAAISAKSWSTSATHATRPASTAATAADASPPNGSHTTSPGSVTAFTIRRMNSSGFWFRCAADSELGLYTRGAARRSVPLIRSTPCSGASRQTLVRACACRQVYRIASHSLAVTGSDPSRE
jgi:hypothetical protein